MDTLLNTSAGNKSQMGLRSALIVAGIVIAIICSLVSLKTIHSTEGEEARALGSIQTPAFVNVDLVVKTAATIGHSVIVLTKE